MSAPPGRTSAAAAAKKSAGIGDMLDDLEREHHIEALALAARGPRRRRPDSRSTRPALSAWARATASAARIGVDPGDGEAQSRHRLGDEAAAAADIEEPQPGEGREALGVAAEVPPQPVADEIRAAPG